MFLTTFVTTITTVILDIVVQVDTVDEEDSWDGKSVSLLWEGCLVSS